jgi:hypothetical protein
MRIEEDFKKLKDDPTFQRLAAHLRSAPPEVVEDLLARCGNVPELCPSSPKAGKRFIADRDKVSVTIDAALLELLEDSAANLDVPLSRIVETAVWQFYRRPALSFQKESDDDTEK